MRGSLQAGMLARSRVLVRVPNWVGDAVICLPALRLLRSLLPEAELALLARPWVRDVLPAEELRARVIPYDTTGPHRGLGGRLQIARRLRGERFDAAVLFQNAFDAALLAWLAGIPLRAGYARQGRRPLLTHPATPPRKGELARQGRPHEAYYYLELLRRLGLVAEYSAVERIELPCSHASRAGARARLRERLETELGPLHGSDAAPLVGISPGATFGTAKRWPAAGFAELARRLRRESGAMCVFFGSPQEQELAEETLKLAAMPALSLAGKTTLAEFMQLAPGCDLFVTNDTGTMHVAAALGVPTLALFGPTNEQETRPLGARVRLVIGEAYCRPCKLRHCPIDHRCMRSISVERALRAALEMLAEPPAPESGTPPSAGTLPPRR